MVRYLGIDYGTKKVGIALTDETGFMAFPLATLPLSRSLVEELVAIAREKRVDAFVLGESKNLRGEDNPLMQTLVRFRLDLERESGLPVHSEPEFYTSAEAKRIQGEGPLTDASAAAIILESYLRKKRENHGTH